MPEYTYVLTLRTTDEATVHAADPREALQRILAREDTTGPRGGSIDRIELYDAGQLVLDTDPRPCQTCGRDEHAGFNAGEPYCHRHL